MGVGRHKAWNKDLTGSFQSGYQFKIYLQEMISHLKDTRKGKSSDERRGINPIINVLNEILKFILEKEKDREHPDMDYLEGLQDYPIIEGILLKHLKLANSHRNENIRYQQVNSIITLYDLVTGWEFHT